MPKVHNSIRVNAPPDKTWRILGNPLATPEWIPGLTSAKVEGKIRVCTTMDGGEIREEIDYSNATRSFRYNQLKVPLPIRNSRGIMRIQHQATGSLVVWDAEFEALDPSQEIQITQMIDGYYKQTLESLRQRVELP